MLWASQNLLLLAAFVATAYVVAAVITAIYRAFFHPLASFKGPKLAGACPIPFIYHRITGNQHRWIQSLHERYGQVVRYLPDTVSYIDPDAWEDIFGHRHNGQGDLPKDMENKMPFIGGNDSIMRLNDADHSRVRRLLAPALADKALREQQEIIKTYIQKLVNKIEAVEADKDKINMMKWYNFTTFDIIADLAFGESLGMLDQGEWAPWVRAINDSIPLTTNVGVISRYFPLLGSLFSFFLPASIFESLHTHLEYSKSQVDKRLVRGAEREDFWKYILRNQNKDTGSLSTRENHALGMTLMVAGSETTAALLGGLTNYLLNSPDEYRRLTTEIREAFSSLDEINIDSLMPLPYLTACIREGLRLYPPTPLGQQRVVPEGGRTVCGQYVPAGTILTISHWSAYRYPAFWNEPAEFHPDRWLSENQDDGPFANDRREVHNPFSFGPRNCIGKNLAYHEARLILATILWHFDFELCEESRDWGKQKVYALAQRGPLMVRPKAVDRKTA